MAGYIDSAIFGSPRMTDEKTVVMGLGKNRTLTYLRQNPHAVWLIMEPGETIMEWKGIRLYLKAPGPSRPPGRCSIPSMSQIAKMLGEASAKIDDGSPSHS